MRSGGYGYPDNTAATSGRLYCIPDISTGVWRLVRCELRVIVRRWRDLPPRGQPRKYNSTISAIVALFQPTALPFPNFSVLPTPFVYEVFQRCAPAAARRPLPLHLRVCRRGSPRYVNAARCGMRRTDLPADKICDQVSDAIVRVFAAYKKYSPAHGSSSSTPACARTRTPRLLARPRPRRG